MEKPWEVSFYAMWRKEILCFGGGWDSFRNSAVIAALQMETCPHWLTPESTFRTPRQWTTRFSGLTELRRKFLTCTLSIMLGGNQAVLSHSIPAVMPDGGSILLWGCCGDFVAPFGKTVDQPEPNKTSLQRPEDQRLWSNQTEFGYCWIWWES